MVVNVNFSETTLSFQVIFLNKRAQHLKCYDFEISNALIYRITRSLKILKGFAGFYEAHVLDMLFIEKFQEKAISNQIFFSGFQ